MERTYTTMQKWKQFPYILTPILVTQISLSLMTFFDTNMSGRFSPADLAGVAVALQNVGAGSLGDVTGEGRDTLVSLKQVLSRLQVSAVSVREDLVALFVAKFSQATRPFCGLHGRRLLRPGERQSRRDEGGSVLFQEFDEGGQQLAGLQEFESQAASHL